MTPPVAAVIVNYRTKALTRAAAASALAQPEVAEVVRAAVTPHAAGLAVAVYVDDIEVPGEAPVGAP